MNKLLAVIFLFSLSFTSYADDDDDQEPPIKEVIDVTNMNPTPIEMRKSILRVMLANNWVISEHRKNTIIAIYDKTAKLKASFNGGILTLEEVKSEDSYFKDSWIRSLKFHFLKDISYYYNIRKAESFIK